MCGIAGIVAFDARERVDGARVRRMCGALRHRGPDDEGVALMGNAGLGHRRLTVIDLVSGQQPMSSPESGACITYNGELYNFRALRRELTAHGCRFETQSDTEVVLRAYEMYGEDCLHRFHGMFAFAIWDRRRGKLFMARDPLGIKPLYYAEGKNELLFASEIKGILAADRATPVLNRAVLPEFLATRYVSGGETFFQGIRKLLPGHSLSWTPEGGVRETRWWRLPQALDESGRDLEDHARELRVRLESAVKSHLMSDVPLGLFLSGGVDSSALAALMAPMMNAPLRSFSVGFAVPGYDEFSYARLAARSVHALHREVVLSGMDFFRALPRLVWHEDEPIAFPSSVCLNFVSRLAREDVKVVLTGEGADELFLGYNRYRVTAWNERLGRPYWAMVPAGVRGSVRGLMARLPRSLRRYAERSFLGPGPGMRALFYENFAVFPDARRERLMPAAPKNRDPYHESLRHYAAAPGGSLERMSHADMQTYMVELLMKQDQMSMAASLESRVPFLDRDLVEYAATIPGRFKLRGWQTKAVLREAVKDLVPKEILNRRKMGFPVPVSRWFRGEFAPLVQDLVLGERALARDLFDAAYLRQMFDEHRAGMADHGDRLWLLVNLEIWQRIFLEGEVPNRLVHEGILGRDTARSLGAAYAAAVH